MAKNLGDVEVVDQDQDLAVESWDWDSDDPNDLGETRTQRESKGRLSAADYLAQNPISPGAATLLDKWADLKDMAQTLGDLNRQIEQIKSIYRDNYLQFVDNAPKPFDLFNANISNKRRPSYIVGTPALAQSDSTMIYRLCGVEKIVEIKVGEVVIPIFITPPDLWDRNLNLVCDLPKGLNGQTDTVVMQKLAKEGVSYRDKIPFMGQTLTIGTGMFPKRGDKVSGFQENEKMREKVQRMCKDANPDAPIPTLVDRHEMFTMFAGFFLKGFVDEANALIAAEVEAHNYMKNLLEIVASWRPRRESDEPRKPRQKKTATPADDSDLYD